MNQLGLLDYILIVLSIIFSWRLQQRAQPPPNDAEATQPLKAAATGAELASPAVAEPDSPLRRKLKHICVVCGYDDIASFIDGAKQAYETIVQAFAGGDIAACAYLLAEPVRAVFVQTLAASAQRGETTQSSFIGFDRFEIVDAQLAQDLASIAVRIEAEMVSVTRDGAGEVVAGDAGQVSRRSEVWTFERDLSARGRGWLLVGTAVD